jgi:hypothetical protein
MANSSHEHALKIYNHLNKNIGSFLQKEQYLVAIDAIEGAEKSVFIKLQLQEGLNQIENDAINLVLDNLDRHYPETNFFVKTDSLAPSLIETINKKNVSFNQMLYSFMILIALGLLLFTIVALIPNQQPIVFAPHRETKILTTITSHKLKSIDYENIDLFDHLLMSHPNSSIQIIRKCLRGKLNTHLYALNALDRLLDPVSKAKAHYFLTMKEIETWQDSIISSLKTEEVSTGLRYISRLVCRSILNTKYQEDSELALSLLKLTPLKVHELIEYDSKIMASLISVTKPHVLDNLFKNLDEEIMYELLEGSLTSNQISKNAIQSFKETLSLVH